MRPSKNLEVGVVKVLFDERGEKSLVKVQKEEVKLRYLANLFRIAVTRLRVVMAYIIKIDDNNSSLVVCTLDLKESASSTLEITFLVPFSIEYHNVALYIPRGLIFL